MSRVLITGIEGFVGRHLARLLLGQGHEVAGVHLAEPPHDLAVELLRGSVCDFAWLRDAVRQTRPDRVVHLAAVSSVAESETHVLETFETNAVGTLNLLEAVRLSGSKTRVLLVSSAAVYGRAGSGGTLTEETPPQPINPYGLSKLAAEEAGRFAHRAFGTDVVILRPFSHTGPGQGPGFVFPTVARRIAAIEKAAAADPGLDRASRTVELGNLDVRPDYTDVRDIVRAYALALDRCEAGETYNVTSGNSLLLRDGVETLIRLARTETQYKSVAARRRERDIPVLHGSAAKLAEATGWQPLIPLEQTLADLLDYYRSL